METLLPQIRKTGSRFFISFNPTNIDDPVQRRFVDITPPRTIVRKVSYLDNPFFSSEAKAERAWLEQVDPDAYRHVWLGEPRTVSDAQILRGKFVAEAFEISPSWFATCEAPGTGLAAVFCAQSPHIVPHLTILGYLLAEMHALGDTAWITSIYDRLRELRAEWKPAQATTAVFVEEGPVFDAVKSAIPPQLLMADGVGNRDLLRVEERDLRNKDRQPLITLDERATDLRASINTGRAVKLSRTGYTQQSTFRSSATNHLTAQVLGYRPHAQDTAQELVAAFLLACLITRA